MFFNQKYTLDKNSIYNNCIYLKYSNILENIKLIFFDDFIKFLIKSLYKYFLKKLIIIYKIKYHKKQFNNILLLKFISVSFH